MVHEEVPGGGLRRAREHRYDTMRDDCVHILVRLLKIRRISIEELAAERGLSTRTVYRWVNSFSFIIPLVIRGRVVIVGDDYDLERLHQLKIFSNP